MGFGVAPLSGRAEHAAGHPRPRGSERDPATKRTHHRHLPGVDGRDDLLPFGPLLVDEYLVLRSCRRSALEQLTHYPRRRYQVARAGTPATLLFERDGWIHTLDPATGDIKSRDHGARRLPLGGNAVGRRQRPDWIVVAVGDRQTGPLRGPRRDLHRSGGEGRLAETSPAVRARPTGDPSGPRTAAKLPGSPTPVTATSC